jgi:hypothetical protein
MRPREFDDDPPPYGTPNFSIAVEVLLYILLQLTNYVLSMQHVIQQTTSPLLDPTQQQDNMIFRMQVEV